MNDLEIEKSKKWIEDFINDCNVKIERDNWDVDDYRYTKITYEVVMNYADYWVNTTQSYPPKFSVGYFSDIYVLPDDEFWHHYEIVRGKKVEEDKKSNFFTCSC